MTELSEQRMQSVPESGETPAAQEAHELLSDPEYDDSPWTAEELHMLAWEAGKHAGWEEMDEYVDLRE